MSTGKVCDWPETDSADWWKYEQKPDLFSETVENEPYEQLRVCTGALYLVAKRDVAQTPATLTNPNHSVSRLRDGIDAPPGYFANPVRGDWDYIRDESLSVRTRLACLSKRWIDEPDLVRRFVADEQLCAPDAVQLDREWRDSLVLFAERLQFYNRDRRCKLMRALLDIAEEHAFDENRSGNEQVAYSAIRMAGSMIEMNEAGRLLRFLGPAKKFDTRLITAIVLVHIYEVAPRQPVPASIANRIYNLALKFLDPDFLLPGQEGAIGCKAVHALAAFCDSRLSEVIEYTCGLDAKWVTMITMRNLRSLRDSWLKSVPLDDEAVVTLDRELSSLAETP